MCITELLLDLNCWTLRCFCHTHTSFCGLFETILVVWQRHTHLHRLPLSANFGLRPDFGPEEETWEAAGAFWAAEKNVIVGFRCRWPGFQVTTYTWSRLLLTLITCLIPHRAYDSFSKVIALITLVFRLGPCSAYFFWLSSFLSIFAYVFLSLLSQDKIQSMHLLKLIKMPFYNVFNHITLANALPKSNISKWKAGRLKQPHSKGISKFA